MHRGTPLMRAVQTEQWLPKKNLSIVQPVVELLLRRGADSKATREEVSTRVSSKVTAAELVREGHYDPSDKEAFSHSSIEAGREIFRG